MNIGEINGVQVAVSPEAYEKIRKQKIIEENKILKELQQELDKYKNIVDELEKWLIAQRNFIETIDIMPNLKEVKLEHKIMINDYTATLDKLKELKGE